MSWGFRAAGRTAAWAALTTACILLVACAAVPGRQAATVTPAAGETRDRITASDEPESSKRSRVRLELASAYFGRGQLTTALDEVKLALAADPTNVAALNLRGLIYGSLGDHQLAEESFRRALQIDARDADSMQNFGWYLCQRKRFDEADTMFRQALAVPNYRDAPRTLLTQGICQARAGQLTQAEGTLTRSYELDPGNPSIAVNLTEVLYRRGEYERARFHIRRVNSNPDIVNAQTLWLAARIENRLGNRQGVQDFGTQLRNRFPQSPEAGAFARGQFDE
ncbi:type IV pilus biogenesis/stability protein PilW [Piscinibacter sp. XHJ-5]|uniref:type IV pilus biogenesis/stability protein PilW n=1 Tax=Piscinibacter sp. XHJ-5 TaxID=3037797 RepID=UPI0024536440|nr:type IV pilus biogenesis/stability protein PilW [Piscinibacter sp. XHJ-5]